MNANGIASIIAEMLEARDDIGAAYAMPGDPPTIDVTMQGGIRYLVTVKARPA